MSCRGSLSKEEKRFGREEPDEDLVVKQRKLTLPPSEAKHKKENRKRALTKKREALKAKRAKKSEDKSPIEPDRGRGSKSAASARWTMDEAVGWFNKHHGQRSKQQWWSGDYDNRSSWKHDWWYQRWEPDSWNQEAKSSNEQRVWETDMAARSKEAQMQLMTAMMIAVEVHLRRTKFLQVADPRWICPTSRSRSLRRRAW